MIGVRSERSCDEAEQQAVRRFAAFGHSVHRGEVHRYVNEFATRHNLREHDTQTMMADTVARMIGKRLTYRELVA